MKRVNPVKEGSEPFQNKYRPFCAVQRKREKSKESSQHLTNPWFYKSLPHTQKKKPVFSKLKKLFCFSYRLQILGKEKIIPDLITSFKPGRN